MQTPYPALAAPGQATRERSGDRAGRGEWAVGARSETGYVRSENEDRMARVRFGSAEAYCVFDGMGGHASGALAAELATRTFCASLAASPARQPLEDSLRLAFAQANEAVYARSRAAGESRANGMGATAVALVTSGSRALVAHVGDSRAYLVRRGRLTRLTRDHSRVQRMVDAGMLTQEQALDHPDTSLVERAVGHQETLAVDLVPWLQLRRGDQLLLCSDGLCGYAGDAEIESVLRADAGPQTLADALVELALSKGGHDNVTVQLVRYGRVRVNRGAVGGPWATAGLVVSLCAAVAAGAFGYRTRIEADAAISRLDARLQGLSVDLAALRIEKAKVSATPALPSATAPAATVAATPAPASEPSTKPQPPAATPPAGAKPQAINPAPKPPVQPASATAKAPKAPVRQKAGQRTTKAPEAASPNRPPPHTPASENGTDPVPAPAPTPAPEGKPAPASASEPIPPSPGTSAEPTTRRVES